MFKVWVCNKPLVDLDGRFGSFQVLLLEAGFFEELDKLFGAVLDRKSLGNRIPAVLLLANEVVRGSESILGNPVLLLFFLLNFCRVSFEAKLVDKFLEVKSII